ncbi:Rrf2 family transcriptional regulator [Synechococcus sp. CBW1108]|uniref:Rrf2 family transcriptional regulator n=1 Tax=Synechococcus sp. CBW1108 TaxID=1353147 RepID=UPI0018CEC6D1|nr:Rrf2 family transcriptional regulator [Synechococcus sp. CBW1108]QPN70329.1 Rrf2 family transcriptional regulator [Synechococcus sp. CBW1108]
MLSKQANHALKALLEMAAEPERWLSTHELAIAQQLPEPMLEQILLRLRRAGVLVARRGRRGGYRLACSPGELSLAAVLIGLGEAVGARGQTETTATDKVTGALERSLDRAQLQALEELRLEDLLFDLRSAEAGATSEAGLLLG